MLVRSVIYRKNGWGFNFIRPFQQKRNFCLPKVPFLFIQAAGLAYHHDAVVDIIKGGAPPLYLITRQRVSYLRLDDIQCFALMIYRNTLRMIYKAYALIYCLKCAIINSQINKNLQVEKEVK